VNFRSAFLPRVALLLILPLALSSAARSAEPERPHVAPDAGDPGTVVKVGADSVTVKPDPKPTEDKAEKAAEDQTFALSKEKTRVWVGVVVRERKTPTGQAIRTTQFNRGTLDDLKAGQAITITAQDGVATAIKIQPPPPEAAEKK
jgi:hypothetical protein